jgi:hypothetical protein
MKYLTVLLLVLAGIIASAQTRIEKSIPLKPGQKAVFRFDYPVVKFQTWDKPEILITGTVSINQGEHDSSFAFDVSENPSGITVVSSLKDKENIPHRISIKKGDREYFFRTSNFQDPEVQKFLAENGNEYAYRSSGIQCDIKLNIFVPRNTTVEIESTHGIVEVLSFDAPLSVNSKYGGVDITLPAGTKGRITARGHYGEILTNLDTRFEQIPGGGKNGKRWTEITTSLGAGPEVVVESKYGNIYLRKSK